MGSIPSEAVTIEFAPESFREELVNSGHSWIARAQEYQISNQSSYDYGVKLLQAIADAKDRVIERYRESKSLANSTHLRICQDEHDLLDPLDVSEQIFKQKIADWDDQQKAIRSEINKFHRNSRAEIMDLPLGSSAPGSADLPVALPRVIPPAPDPYIRSEAITRTRAKYKAEIYNIRLLCAAVADGMISPMYVEGAMPQLDALADAEGTALNVPGVRAVKDNRPNIRVRRRS